MLQPGERGVLVDGTQDQGFEADRAREREGRLRERGDAGHVRRCHGGAFGEPVDTARPGRVDVRAGRGQVDRLLPVVREPGAHVVLVGGADGEDVGEVEARGVVGSRVRVLATVAGGRDEERSVRVGIRDRVLESLRELLPAPGVVRGDRAHPGRVKDRADRVVCGSLPVRAEELERHDLDVPVHAGNADSVRAGGPDRPGDVRAVAVVVERVVVVVHEVPAVDVVDVAVAVVVDAVARTARARLARVRPDVRREIGVVPVHARVDHRDDNRRASGRGRPGLGSVDVRIRGSRGGLHRLTGVVQAPELAEERVVRKRVDRGRRRPAPRSARAGPGEAPRVPGPGRRPARRRRRRESGEGVRWRSHPRARGRRAARPRARLDRSRRGCGHEAPWAAARRLRALRKGLPPPAPA